MKEKDNLEMKISSTKSSRYWYYLRQQLEGDLSDEETLKEAFDLFIERIESRYLNIINHLEKDGKREGEGFTIVTILCSLIEFLETTRRGINFVNKKSGDLLEFEYNNGCSKKFFISFLTKQKSFLLSEDLAREFYSNVRCALIHEAQTKGGWRIRVDTPKLITKYDSGYILNPVILNKKIYQYIYLYKKELFSSEELKLAFIRKFDSICEN